MDVKSQLTIILVGAGNMGGAMLRGWTARGLVAVGSTILDPAPSSDIQDVCATHGMAIARAPTDSVLMDCNADLVVLAFKPQLASAILPSLYPVIDGRTVLSVMAGQSLSGLHTSLRMRPGSSPLPMIRAMPNVGSAIGAGATGLFANHAVSETMRAQVTALMEAIGTVAWVAEEGQIDVVTAVSGSGPAYFFLLTEALTDAGIAAGLSVHDAAALARATAYGAGTLLHTDPRDADELRRSVTSPGGTTAAALAAFENGGMRALVDEAVKAAITRAKEIAAG